MMGAEKNSARASPHRLKTTPAGRPRPPRLELPRPTSLRLAPQLSTPLADDAVRLWFSEEADALQRLAHTQRLKGDFVAAQTLEGEIRTLAADMNALLQTPLTGE